MSTTFGVSGAKFPWLGRLVQNLTLPYYLWRCRIRNLHPVGTAAERETVANIQSRIAAGETCYVVGMTPAGHNTGVALIALSQARGIEIIANDEEERLTGDKHCDQYPEQSLELLKRRLAQRGIRPEQIAAWCLGWDYGHIGPFAFKNVFEEWPTSWLLINPNASPRWRFWPNVIFTRTVTRRLQQQFGLPALPKVLMMPHHENHAALSYGASPFAQDGEKTIVLVVDGWGDDGAISFFLGEQGKLTKLYSNDSLMDSLGAYYSVISSTQGGWTTLSSEGRYMGAVAWGDQNRLTNPFYKQLRQIFHFESDGRLLINRKLCNWQNAGEFRPYTRQLSKMIGPPVPLDKMWNPDAVLNVADVAHSQITQRRVDLAAATQLVFEDAVFHMVDHLIRTTGSSRLVFTGGTALNALANMELLERYNEAWYERNLNRRDRLHLWVPPVPGDAGIPLGAAFNIAMRAGLRTQQPLQHAYYCGVEPTRDEIVTAIENDKVVRHELLGNISEPAGLELVADQLAYIIAHDGAVGLYHGSAETGPRALGHRSILANPCNPASLENINRLVKFREPIRPLAPMVTDTDAAKYFVLSPGAADDDYNAYRYMVMTTHVHPVAHETIPAVIHKDGTARIQIVREADSPFVYAYLKAMGRRVGAEVSVNTSLNVGSPIVQTPQQALEAFQRAKAMTALLMIADTGEAYLVWHTSTESPRDGGELLHQWLDDHAKETGRSRMATPPLS
ncbi:MAG: hypothetical protein KDA58_03850 [Planctomycetaceae bacterium]|nr:hypothetical protein [Planctomycetaceae bacterium]